MPEITEWFDDLDSDLVGFLSRIVTSDVQPTIVSLSEDHIFGASDVPNILRQVIQLFGENTDDITAGDQIDTQTATGSIQEPEVEEKVAAAA